MNYSNRGYIQPMNNMQMNPQMGYQKQMPQNGQYQGMGQMYNPQMMMMPPNQNQYMSVPQMQSQPSPMHNSMRDPNYPAPKKRIAKDTRQNFQNQGFNSQNRRGSQMQNPRQRPQRGMQQLRQNYNQPQRQPNFKKQATPVGEFKKTKMCQAFMEGNCTRQQCNYAHSQEELRPKPNLFKTKFCTLNKFQKWQFYLNKS